MSQGKRKRKGKSKGPRKPRTVRPTPDTGAVNEGTSADGLDLAKAAPAPADTPSARRRRRAEEGGDSALPLERERSLGRIFGLLGLLATVMTFVGIAFANRETQGGERQAVSLFGSGGDDVSESEELENFAAGDGDQLLATLLQAGSLLIAIAVGLFLLWLVRNRNDLVPRKLKWLTVAGPLLFIASIVLIHVALRDVADEFVGSGARTDERAEDVRGDSGLLLVGGGFDLVGRVVFALWLGLLSREMMRVELLTRFLGIFGIGAAFAFVLGALGVDIGLAMYIGWLASVAILCLGRWPGGRPEGWLYRIEPET